MAENLVIIPTYNEKENIEKIIRYVFNLPMAFDILVVEDNSPDGTADIVKRLMQEFPDRLFIEERKGKLGLGTAYIMALNGLWSVIISMLRRWTLIFRITLTTSSACMMLAPTEQTSLSAHVTNAA